MTRPPAFHVWKFLMKNMIPTNSGLMELLQLGKTHAGGGRETGNQLVGVAYIILYYIIAMPWHGDRTDSCQSNL